MLSKKKIQFKVEEKKKNFFFFHSYKYNRKFQQKTSQENNTTFEKPHPWRSGQNRHPSFPLPPRPPSFLQGKQSLASAPSSCDQVRYWDVNEAAFALWASGEAGMQFLICRWGEEMMALARSQDRWKQKGVSGGPCRCSPAIAEVVRKLEEPCQCCLEAGAASLSNLIMMQLTSLWVLRVKHSLILISYLGVSNPKQRLSECLLAHLMPKGHYKILSDLRSLLRNALAREKGWLIFMELQGRETIQAFLVVFLAVTSKSNEVKTNKQNTTNLQFLNLF